MQSLNDQILPKVNWFEVHGEYVDGFYEGLLRQLESQLKSIKTNLLAQSKLFIKGDQLTVNSIDLAREEAGVPDGKWTLKPMLDYADARRFSSVSEKIQLFIKLIDELDWEGHTDNFDHLLSEARKINQINYEAALEQEAKRGGS